VALLLAIVRWGITALAVLVGLWTLDRESIVWAGLTIVLYGGPLLTQFMGPRWRYVGAWVALFMIGQTMLTLALGPGDYRTLQPNLHQEVDVQAGLPGISGVQTITTDARGFRVTRPVDYARKAGFRVFAIGASTTEQIYLDDRSTWTHLLQEGLSARRRTTVEVVNTGLSGLRAVHHLATLQRIARDHPDLVVILIGLNDWNWHVTRTFTGQGYPDRTPDPNAEFRRLFLRNSLLGNAVNALRRRPAPASSIEHRVDRGEYYSAQRNSLARATRLSFRPSSVDPDYVRSLARLDEECRRQGVPCLFITQPSAYQPAATAEVRSGFWMTPPNQDYTLDFESMVAIADLYNRHLRDFAAAGRRTVCDAAPLMEPTLDNFYDDCHFNVRGTQRFA
jgi:hypothetical protein